MTLTGGREKVDTWLVQASSTSWEHSHSLDRFLQIAEAKSDDVRPTEQVHQWMCIELKGKGEEGGQTQSASVGMPEGRLDRLVEKVCGSLVLKIGERVVPGIWRRAGRRLGLAGMGVVLSGKEGVSDLWQPMFRRRRGGLRRSTHRSVMGSRNNVGILEEPVRR